MSNRHQVTPADSVATPATTFGARLRAAAQRLRAQRDDELGREQEQTVVRTVIVAGVVVYLLAAWPDSAFAAGLPRWLVFLIGYLVLSIGVMAFTFRTTTASRARQTTMNVGDAVTISYMMIAAGEIGIPLFVLYLWITIGNGFRFGLKAMGVSVVLCLAGFAVVVALSPVWQHSTVFAASVFFALLVLPIYVAHLIVLLNRALAKAAQHDLLARVNQDLQTPLRNIAGAAELLENNQRLSPEERSLLTVMHDAVQLSLKQIENVLDFSRLESGTLVLEPADCDLHDVINDAAEMVRPTAMQKGLRLLVRIAPQTPYRLVCDARRLRDVLLHLLSHAVQHTDNGLVCLDVDTAADEPEHVTVQFEIHEGGAARGADRRNDNPLAIAIALQLVELMGGRLSAERTRDNRGLRRFAVRFSKQPQGDGADLKLPGMRVLLLTQDAPTIDHFRRTLVQAEGQLLPTASATEALDLLTRAIRLGNPVHALLIDANLALAPDGSHRVAELGDKALSANVSTVLIGDIAPPAEQLRNFGYCAVLSRRAAAQQILTALHAIPLWRVNTSRGVVNVAPWLWARRETRRPRILVADDNRTNLMIVRRMLEQAGYDVDDKATGTEALESLCSGNYRLAILDMHMPDLSGISVLRQYRLRRPRSRLPTIVLTANVSLDAQQQSADAGADAYLAKPVTTADLLNEVERLVRYSEVEVLTPPPDDDTTTAVETVLRVDVLAELDRLYQNPDSLVQIVHGYQHEGADLLEKIGQECRANNHAAFGEWIRALKSNAANMGAVKLMRACNEIELLGMVDFRRQREQLLARLQTAFTESLDALYDIVRDARPPSAHRTD